MTSLPIPEAFDVALQDLRTRTLGRLQGDFARLVYLASTRNYNTGRYEHDGLTFRYGMPVAERVLVTAHREVFLRLALRSLEDLTVEVQQYVFFESDSPEARRPIDNTLSTLLSSRHSRRTAWPTIPEAPNRITFMNPFAIVN